MSSLDHLFSVFGGPAEIGRAIGKTTEHAAAMRRRGSIPITYWPALIKSARERAIDGISYESLALMHSPPASEPAEAQP